MRLSKAIDVLLSNGSGMDRVKKIEAKLVNESQDVPLVDSRGRELCCLRIQRHRVVGSEYMYSIATTITKRVVRRKHVVGFAYAAIDSCGTSLKEALEIMAERSREHHELIRYRLELALKTFVVHGFTSIYRNLVDLDDLERDVMSSKITEVIPLDSWMESPVCRLMLSRRADNLNPCKSTVSLPVSQSAKEHGSIRSEIEAYGPDVIRTIKRLITVSMKLSTVL